MNQRDTRIDSLKVLGAFAVVLLHVSGSVVSTDRYFHSESWWIGNIGEALSRWCVPIFVMISGALLLSQPSDLAPLDFYIKRIGRLFIPIIFWTPFYVLLNAFIEGKFVPLTLGQSLSYLVIGPSNHLWYIYMLIGLYLLTPFLRIIVVSSTPFVLRLFIIGSFAIAAIEVMIVGDDGTCTFFSRSIPFVGYFVAGHYLYTKKSVPRRSVLALGAIAHGVLICVGTGALLLLSPNRWGILYNWLDPLIIVMSLCVFQLFLCSLNLNPDKRGWFQGLSRMTFGVYLIHPFWLMVLHEMGVNGFLYHPLIGIPVTTIVAFLLSAMSAVLFSSIPFLRRTVL
jgi:surface polysaccharide O-acyltransferase-like enzyme